MRAVLALAAVFVAGVLAGAAGHAAWQRRVASQQRAARETEMRQRAGRRYEAQIPEMLLSLGLDAAQRDRVEGIVRRLQPVADTIMSEVGPRVRALDLTARQQVLCVLTPAQRDRLARERAERHLATRETEAWMTLVREGRCGEVP
jgi:hypothetical protein